MPMQSRTLHYRGSHCLPFGHGRRRSLRHSRGQLSSSFRLHRRHGTQFRLPGRREGSSRCGGCAGVCSLDSTRENAPSSSSRRAMFMPSNVSISSRISASFMRIPPFHFRQGRKISSKYLKFKAKATKQGLPPIKRQTFRCFLFAFDEVYNISTVRSEAYSSSAMEMPNASSSAIASSTISSESAPKILGDIRSEGDLALLAVECICNNCLDLFEYHSLLPPVFKFGFARISFEL